MSSQSQQPDADEPANRSPTVIPQDKTGSAHALVAGLTFPDIIFIIGPTLVAFLIAVKIFRLSPSRYLLGGLALLAFSLFSIVKLTDWYMTPVEFAARGVSHIRERIRMPLVGEAARDVPGIVDVHPDADAVEERDSTLVAYVYVYLTNTSLHDESDIHTEIAHLMTGFNSEIGRAEGGGFDLKMCISQVPGSPTRHIKGLNEAATNSDLPAIGQRYAAEQAGHIVDELDDKGVMDRMITIAVPVSPDDVNVSGGILDKASGSSFVKSSTDQYAAQKSLLETRVNTVKSALGSVTNTRQLDTDEVVSLYRQYWLDQNDSLSYTNIATDTLPMGDPDLRTLMGEVSALESGSAQPERADGGTAAVDSDSGSSPSREPGSESGLEPRPEDDSNQPPAGPVDRSESLERSGEGDANDQLSNGVSSKLGSLLGSVVNASESARIATSHAAREQAMYAPSYIDAHMKAVELNDQFTSTLWVTGWPIIPQPELLSSILAVPDIRYDMSIYFHSREHRAKIDEIESDRKTTTSIGLEDIGGVDDGGDAEALAGDMGQLRDAMRDDDMECFEVSVAITVRGDTKEELQWARREIKSRASGQDISVDECHSRQRDGLVSTSPSSVDAFEDSVHVDTRFDLASDSVAHLYPFGGYYRADPDGCTYGIVRTIDSKKDHLGVLQVDRRTLGVSHCCWIGRSGSGKTFDCQSHTIEELLRYPERKAVVVDVKDGGFDGLVEAFNGTKVTVGDTTINPFEVRPPSETGGVVTPLKDQIRLLLDMFEIYLMSQGPDEEAEQVRSTNSAIIRKLYEDFGITSDPETHDPANRDESDRNPVMDDYFEMLGYAENNLDEFTKIAGSDLGKEGLEDDLKILINRLKEFDDQGEYDFLCGESTVNLYDRVVYFDMHNYRKDDSATKGMMLSIITAHAYRMIDQALVNVVVDEAHDMFADAGRAGKIESMVRQGREAGLMFDFITQSDADFESGAARVIADQSPIKVWRDLGGGRQRVSPTEFGLSPSQAQLVEGGLVSGDNSAMDRSDAIVDIDGDQYFVEKRVSEYAQRVIEYKETKHGDFEEYMADAGFGSVDPSAVAPDQGRGVRDKPKTGPDFDREQFVEDVYHRESSVYGGAPGGETTSVDTGTGGIVPDADVDATGRETAPDPSEASASSEVGAENSGGASSTIEEDAGPAIGEAEDSYDDTSDKVETESITETETEGTEDQSDAGLLGRSVAVLTSPITKLGEPVSDDLLADDTSESEPNRGPEIADIPSLTPEEETALREAGYETPFQIWNAGRDTVAEIDSIGPEYAETICQRAGEIIDPGDVPHRVFTESNSDTNTNPNDTASTGTGAQPESSDRRGTDTADDSSPSDDDDSGPEDGDRSDDEDGENEASDTGLVGRAKAAVVAPVTALGSSNPEREPELTDIAPIKAERAAILTEAGFETPLAVWQADQRELSRLDRFDPTLADAVQRYAADLVDRESIPVSSDSSADEERTASDSDGDNESADGTETESRPDNGTDANATTPETTEGPADEQAEPLETEGDATTEFTTDPDQHSPDDGVREHFDGERQKDSEGEESGNSEGLQQSSDGTDPDTNALCGIDGIGGNRAEALSEVGIETPAELATADIQTIAEADGVGKKRAQNYKSAVTARSDGGPDGDVDVDVDKGENEGDQ